MNKKITKTRDKEKKHLLETAKKLIKKIQDSGLIQGYIAKEIKVSEQTLSRFMALHNDYITSRICSALTEFFDKR